MTHYLMVENDEIIGASECTSGGDILDIEVSEELYNSWKEDHDKYIYSDGAIIENPDYDEIKRQKEQEHINNLTITAQDLLDLIANNGVSWEEIDSFLNANKEFKLRLTTCQNVFCGVLRQFLPLSIGNVTLTDSVVVNAFKVKNGELPD